MFQTALRNDEIANQIVSKVTVTSRGSSTSRTNGELLQKGLKQMWM